MTDSGGTAPQNFEGLDLAGQCFAGRDLSGANFRGALLCGVDFTASILVGADFTGAVLSEDGAWGPIAARFDQAVLSHAIFDGTPLDGVRFVGAHLTGASFTACSCGPDHPDFTGATLDGTTFDSALGEAFAYSVRMRNEIFLLREAADSAKVSNDLETYLVAQEAIGMAYLNSDLWECFEYAEYEFSLLAEACEHAYGRDDPRTLRSACLWAVAAAEYGAASYTYDGQPSEAMRKFIQLVIARGPVIPEGDLHPFSLALTSVVRAIHHEIDECLEWTSDEAPRRLAEGITKDALQKSANEVLHVVNEALSHDLAGTVVNDAGSAVEADLLQLAAILRELEGT